MNIDCVNEKSTRRSASKIFLIILIVFYLLQKMPIVSYYMNTYISMVLLVSMLILSLLADRTCHSRVPILLIVTFFYAGFYIIDLAIDNVPLLNMIWSMFLAIMPIFVGVIIVYNKMEYLVKFIVPLTLVTYAVTALTTYVGLLENPEASRLMAADPTAYHQYFPHNIGGFDFVYSFVLLHPLMICVLRRRNFWYFAVLISVIGGLCIVASEYTTATLLFLISCMAYFFPSKATKSQSRLRGYFIIFVSVIVLLFLPAIFDWMAGLELFSESAEKLRDVANVLRGQESEAIATQNRLLVYEQSWTTFLKHPLFGAKALSLGTSGGHSFFLDILAEWGLFGFTLVATLYYYLHKLQRYICGDSSVSLYAMLFFLLVLIICALNPHAWLFELGFAAPMFLYYAVHISEQKHIQKKGDDIQ